MIIFGTGGHSKVVFSACNSTVTGFFDDFSKDIVFRNKPVSKYSKSLFTDEKVIVAIGDNKIRKKIVEQVDHGFESVIHSSALVEASSSVGEGSQILHGSIIQADVKIGKHTIVNTGASIDHDSSIGDFCHIAPQVTLCGSVAVGEGTIIGAGATVIPGITIGNWCKIGAGSVITKDIPDNAIAVGNPARVIKSQ